jgi:hypothetical protein
MTIAILTARRDSYLSRPFGMDLGGRSRISSIVCSIGEHPPGTTAPQFGWPPNWGKPKTGFQVGTLFELVAMDRGSAIPFHISPVSPKGRRCGQRCAVRANTAGELCAYAPPGPRC